MLFDKINSKFHLRLKDRNSAGNILGEALKDIIKNEKERTEETIVLGIPRGGVIVADVVAKKISCEFDIVIPRKLGAPHNEEVAIGAVMEDGTTYLNDEIVRVLEVSKGYVEQEKARQIEEIKRRSLLYRNSQRDYKLGDKKNIVLVDDGAATGATIIAAAKWIRRSNNNTLNQKLIIIIPVAPKDTLHLLKKEGEADHVEVITSPSTSSFKSVGQYYQSFEPVSDEQVIRIMRNYKLTS
jgi:putative phosphoribosyl transferase